MDELPDCIKEIIRGYVFNNTTYSSKFGLDVGVVDLVTINDFVVELTGSHKGFKKYEYKMRDILCFISAMIEEYGENAFRSCSKSFNPGGFSTIVVYWLNNLSDELLFD